MTVKELKEILSKYNDDINVFISSDNLGTMAFPIEDINEKYTLDADEPSIVVIKY